MRTALWFDLIRVEIDAMDENSLIEPDAQVAEGEKVKGEIELDLRKLYSRNCQMKAEFLRFAADEQSARDAKDRARARVKMHELGEKGKLLTGIFWAGIRDEFGLWSRESIGIRAGWKAVVIEKDDSPDSPLDFLKGLFGG